MEVELIPWNPTDEQLLAMSDFLQFVFGTDNQYSTMRSSILILVKFSVSASAPLDHLMLVARRASEWCYKHQLVGEDEAIKYMILCDPTTVGDVLFQAEAKNMGKIKHNFSEAVKSDILQNSDEESPVAMEEFLGNLQELNSAGETLYAVILCALYSYTLQHDGRGRGS